MQITEHTYTLSPPAEHHKESYDFTDLLSVMMQMVATINNLILPSWTQIATSDAQQYSNYSTEESTKLAADTAALKGLTPGTTQYQQAMDQFTNDQQKFQGLMMTSQNAAGVSSDMVNEETQCTQSYVQTAGSFSQLYGAIARLLG